MARLGIVAGLAREAASLGRGVPFTGRIAELSDNVFLAVSGMGPRRARGAGEALLGRRADALVSWGTAAALDPRLAPGTLLLPERIVTAGGREASVDAKWQARLRHRLGEAVPVCVMPLAESPAVLATPRTKQSLREGTGAASADMESAALAGLARERGVPFLVVRAVADSAEVTLPGSVLNALEEDGTVRVGRLLAGLLPRPGEWLDLLRLARGFARARATLIRVARRAGPRLEAPG
jgi:adenosylhomocysteine nucleosidase